MPVKLQGGGDRGWLVPLRADGRSQQREDAVDVVGCHRGDYAGLNVANPQPGYEYQWGNNRPQSVLGARARGWTPVRDGDPDCPAYELVDEYNDSTDTPTQLDTIKPFGGLILLRTPVENLRRLHEDHDKESAARLQGSAEGYLQGASYEEQALGRSHEGKYLPTRFARREHGTTVQEGDEVVRQYRTGIFQE